jgi:hypothetical protein
MNRDRFRWPLCEHQQFAVNLDRDQLGRSRRRRNSL